MRIQLKSLQPDHHSHQQLKKKKEKEKTQTKEDLNGHGSSQLLKHEATGSRYVFLLYTGQWLINHRVAPQQYFIGTYFIQLGGERQYGAKFPVQGNNTLTEPGLILQPRD